VLRENEALRKDLAAAKKERDDAKAALAAANKPAEKAGE